MEIYAPQISRQARPGQFVHLRCLDNIEPLLRRPISFHRFNGNSFTILYRKVGRGTNLLTKKQKGDRIDALGPLGNGFKMIGRTKDERRGTILVAGGMGVAPLLALAEKLYEGRRAKGEGHRENNMLVLLGAKTKKEVLCEKDFRSLGAEVQVATDDGSLGYKGLVSGLLERTLRRRKDEGRGTICACGPRPMLEKVARMAAKRRIDAYASLEENMACGVGACLGCAVRTKNGYRRVCKDGPVFNLKDIIW